ncbi:MAG: hypothetical protein GQ542_15040 [Desulforhopalus sp.]|nr:hypothetical protein [Desulforhopalus sp.]
MKIFVVKVTGNKKTTIQSYSLLNKQQLKGGSSAGIVSALLIIEKLSPVNGKQAGFFSMPLEGAQLSPLSGGVYVPFADYFPVKN